MTTFEHQFYSTISGSLTVIHIRGNEFREVLQFLRIEVGVEEVRRAGVMFAGAAILLVIFVLIAAPARRSSTQIVVPSATWAILVPFLLPAVHERYFFLADVLSVVAALWLPSRLWYLPILTGTASFLSYLPFLFPINANGDQPNIDSRFLSTLMFVALVVLAELRRGLDLSRVLATRELGGGGSRPGTSQGLGQGPPVTAPDRANERSGERVPVAARR